MPRFEKLIHIPDQVSYSVHVNNPQLVHIRSPIPAVLTRLDVHLVTSLMYYLLS